MLAIIKEQIGREPRGVLGVSTRCEHNFPQVIVNRPVSATYSNIEIFPTLYWLTCPYLRKELASLEAEGKVAYFEKKIQEDPEFAALVEQNHANYAKRRLDLIPAAVQANLKEEYPERFKVLAETGVGGIRGLEGVKCLHTHVADYLVHGENPIGAEALACLEKSQACSTKQCKDFIS